MSAHRTNHIAPASNDRIPMKMVRQMRNFMNNWEVSGASFSFDGYKARLRVDQKPGGGAPATPPHPWKTTRNDDTETETKRVRVHPGSIGGVVPTNVFPPLTISGTGLEFVVLDVSINPANGGVSSCSLSIESTQPTPPVPTPSAPTSSFADVIAVIYDGSVYQVRSRNLNAFSQELFQETVEEPAIGERNYIPWYVWNVVEAI